MAAAKRTTSGAPDRLAFAHYDFGAALVYLNAGSCSSASCQCQEILVDELLQRRELLSRLTPRDQRRVRRFARLRQRIRQQIARAVAAAARRERPL